MSEAEVNTAFMLIHYYHKIKQIPTRNAMIEKYKFYFTDTQLQQIMQLLYDDVYVYSITRKSNVGNIW